MESRPASPALCAVTPFTEQCMSIRDAILPEFEHEVENTRKVLERIPDDQLDWRPHVKSATMGGLAGHLAELPKWTDLVFTTDELDAAAGMPEQQVFTSRAEILAEFDASVNIARAALKNVSDETLMKPWTFRKGDHVILSLPRAAVLRGFVMSHSIHHRAQLGTYLRMHDVPLPSIYGPSADEGNM